MVTFEHLRKQLAEHEASLTAEEKAKRDREHEESLRSLAKRHEEMLAPFRHQEQMMRSLASAVRPFHDLVDTPSLRAMQDFATSPSFESIQASAEKMREAMDVPSIRALMEPPGGVRALLREQEELRRATEVFQRPKMLEDVQRMLARTAELEQERFRPTPIPEFRPQVMRVRDEDQDERFERLTNTVSEQTAVLIRQEGELVELRSEVRSVRESAARDARTERQVNRRRDEGSERTQWWLLFVGALVTVVLGAVAKVLGWA